MLALQAACAGGGSAHPAWILNPPQHPGRVYAVGSAEVYGDEAAALARARDQARLELAKQIEVEVQGALQSLETVTSDDGRESLSSRVQNLVVSRVPPLKLSHVTFIDGYSDVDGKRVYALAELNLRRESQALEEQIAALDQTLAQQAQHLTDAGRLDIHALRAFALALFGLQERAALQARLNKLVVTAHRPLLSREQQTFKERLLDAFGQLQVSVKPRGEPEEALHQGLSRRLTEQGFRLSANGSDLCVIYDLSSEERLRDGTHFITTEGRVSLEDASGRVIAAFRARAKGSSASGERARSRSLDRLADRLGERLLEALLPTP